jgi:hypothetical protein
MPEKGHELSEAARANMARAQMNRPPITHETREKMRRAHTGHEHSNETKKKISQALTGHGVSKETREKLSAHFTGRNHSEEAKANMREAALAREAKKRREREAAASGSGTSSAHAAAAPVPDGNATAPAWPAQQPHYAAGYNPVSNVAPRPTLVPATWAQNASGSSANPIPPRNVAAPAALPIPGITPSTTHTLRQAPSQQASSFTGPGGRSILNPSTSPSR